MTVIPFAPRLDAEPDDGAGPPPLATVPAVTGSLYSPRGRVGCFTGSYRLERFVSQRGQLAAAGVFTGKLTDADGSHIGIGSRRLTATVQVAVNETALEIRLGPLDVNLLGFRVTVDKLTMDLSLP